MKIFWIVNGDLLKQIFGFPLRSCLCKHLFKSWRAFRWTRQKWLENIQLRSEYWTSKIQAHANPWISVEVDTAQSILTREHLDQCIIMKQMKPLISSDTDANGILLACCLLATESQSHRVTDTQWYSLYGWVKFFCAWFQSTRLLLSLAGGLAGELAGG